MTLRLIGVEWRIIGERWDEMEGKIIPQLIGELISNPNIITVVSR